MIEQAAGSSQALSRVCVVVPCYNEAHRLDTSRFAAFLAARKDVLILFVDDGSRDRTAEMIQALVDSFPESTRILRLPINAGKAEAVRKGVLYAVDKLRPAIVGFWDADLATPLESIPRFVDVLCKEPRIEMIFGARVQLLGRHVQRSAIRHYLGRIFATTVSAALKLAIYDTQCGAKLFRVQAETRQIFAEPFLSKWVFDVEILARYKQLFTRKNKRLEDAIYEYPLESWVDVAGSKVGPADFFVAFWDILHIRNKYLIEKSPPA